MITFISICIFGDSRKSKQISHMFNLCYQQQSNVNHVMTHVFQQLLMILT